LCAVCDSNVGQTATTRRMRCKATFLRAYKALNRYQERDRFMRGFIEFSSISAGASRRWRAAPGKRFSSAKKRCC
jgi:hypothetical protein